MVQDRETDMKGTRTRLENLHYMFKLPELFLLNAMRHRWNKERSDRPLNEVRVSHRCITERHAIRPGEKQREQGAVTVSDVTCLQRAAYQLVWEAFRLGSVESTETQQTHDNDLDWRQHNLRKVRENPLESVWFQLLLFRVTQRRCAFVD